MVANRNYRDLRNIVKTCWQYKVKGIMSRHNSSWYLVYFSKWLSGTCVHIYLIEDRQMRLYCQWFEPKHNLNVLLCYMVIHNQKCDIVKRANLNDRNGGRRRNQLFRNLGFCYLIIVGICVVRYVILFLFVWL